MKEYVSWNHLISVFSISALVILSPQSLTSLMRTPIGLAVVILAIASITADTPALGILALALAITEKKEVEGFEGEDHGNKNVNRAIKGLRRGGEWRNKHCVEENGVLVFQDGGGNAVGKDKAAAVLSDVTFAEGCDSNPCARACVSLVSK